MGDFSTYIHEGLTKLLNSSLIKSIYPMIEHIEAYDIKDMQRIILKIYVNDPEISRNNMYQKGLDPHYLVNFHLPRYTPYFSIPESYKYGFSVIAPNGETIKTDSDYNIYI